VLNVLHIFPFLVGKFCFGFGVFTAGAKKKSFLRSLTRSAVKVSQRFGETYHLHLHGRRASQARSQHEADIKQIVFYSLQPCCYMPEDRAL
jgi:hypothetical protein